MHTKPLVCRTLGELRQLRSRIPPIPIKQKIVDKEQQLSAMLDNLKGERAKLEAQYESLVLKLDLTKNAISNLTAELEELAERRRSEMEDMLLIPEFIDSTRQYLLSCFDEADVLSLEAASRNINDTLENLQSKLQEDLTEFE
jgi:chromosome segregation ATPase